MISETIKPTTEAQARKKFRTKYSDSLIKTIKHQKTIDSLEHITYSNDEFNDDDDEIEVIDTSKLKAKKTEIEWLEKSTSIIDYNFIPEERKYLNVNENKCVEDNLYGIYSEHIKKITIDYIRELGQKYYGDSWKYTDGYTSKFILDFCQKHNISMYAFDINNKCFLKHITKKRHYPALFYYAVNGHIYLIKNEKRCKELMEKAKEHDCENFNSSVVETIQSNVFDKFKYYDENTREIKYKIEQNISGNRPPKP